LATSTGAQFNRPRGSAALHEFAGELRDLLRRS
jgi:hypothetical protein